MIGKILIRKWLTTGLLVLLIMDLLAACGSKSTGQPTSTIQPPTNTASAQDSPTSTTALPTSLPVTSSVSPTNSPEVTGTPAMATATPGPVSPATGVAATTGKLELAWGTAPDSVILKRQRNLSGVAVDDQGTLYITDNSTGQILKYDSGGRLLADLGREGQPPLPDKITTDSSQSRVGHPAAIALDMQGRVYVLDGNSYGIHKFERNGQYLGTFRAVNGGGGSLVSMTVDETGAVYVLDRDVGQVRKFDNDGHFLQEWGNPTGNSEPGLLDGKFKYPGSIAADGKGHIFVADSGNYRIEKFDLNGKFLLKWGSQGSGDGQFNQVYGTMSFDTQANLYLTDGANYRVDKFDSQGRFLAKWGTQGSGNGQFNVPRGVAVDRQGNLYVADVLNERVQKLDQQGQWLASYGRQDQGEGQLSYPTGIGLDAAGNLYAVDALTQKVQKFDSQGRFLLEWQLAKDATKPGELLNLAVDRDGNSYIGPTIRQQILKYDSQGHFLLEWGSEGRGEGQFNRILGLAVDRQNQVWVADGGNYRLQKFDPQGHFLSKLDFSFFTAASPDDRYQDAPLGLVLDDQDQIYVTFSRFVRKFDRQGQFLLKWGDPDSPSGDGQFILPSTLMVDGQGFIYLMEAGNYHSYGSRLQKFDRQGNLKATWNSLLQLPMDPYIVVPAPDQFLLFQAMTVDRAGNIYLADSTFGRVEKFYQK